MIKKIKLSNLFLGMSVLFVWACDMDVAAGQQQETASSRLTLLTGDELGGQLVKWDGHHLHWRSPLFRKPVVFEAEMLGRIQMSTKGDATADSEKGPRFLVQMLDGSSVQGQIDQVTTTQIEMSETRAGQVRILRDQVRSIVRSDQGLESSSPSKLDLKKWKSERDEKKFWRLNESGYLETIRPNVHIFQEQKFGDSVIVDIELRWQKNLDFVLGLGIPKMDTRQLDGVPRIELWEDSLVFFYNDDFEIVAESIDKNKKQLRLKIWWDRKNERMVIRDQQGKQLASFAVEKPDDAIREGLFLLNKLGDLMVSSLSVWEAETGFDSSRPAIQWVGKSAINATVKSFDGTDWIVQLAEGQEDRIPADRLQSAFFNVAAISPADAEHRLIFTDGDLLLGRVEAVNEGTATFRTLASDTLWNVSLDGAKALNWENRIKREFPGFRSQLVTQEGTVMGRLVEGSGAALDVMRWEMPGMKEPVAFAGADARVIVSGAENRATDSDRPNRRWPDTIYLNNGDIVPCSVLGVDENEVTINSFVAAKRVPVREIKALDLQGSGKPVQVDIDHPLWEIPQSRGVKRVGEGFRLQDGGVLQHSQLYSMRQIQFELKWNKTTTLVCQLGCDTGQFTGGTTIRVSCDNESIYVLDGESQLMGNAHSGDRQSAIVEFREVGGEIVVRADSQILCRVPSLQEGSGVRFELANSLGRNASVSLKNFEYRLNESRGAAHVDQNRKELLLTIPRLKRNAPPKNIICARNHDLLRGDVVELSDDVIKIRTNQDLVTFPREIVSSIVWLHADKLGDAKDEAENGQQATEEPASRVDEPNDWAADAMQFVLVDNRRMSVRLTGWKEKELLGESRILGPCEIPLDEIRELRIGTYRTSMRDVPYSDWIAKLAPAPKMETAEGAGGQVFGSQSPIIGKSFPRMVLNRLDGSQPRLESLKGKVVVLDFWATWCGPCIQALPKIRSVVSSYPDDEVVLLAVNQEESKEQVEAFLERKQLQMDVVLDSGPLSRKFLVDAIPQTVLIDQEGVIRFVKVGASNDLEEKLRKAIDSLLSPAQPAN